MELFKLQMVSNKLQLSADEVKETLQQNGIAVANMQQTLKELAKSSGKSAQEIYKLLEAKSSVAGGEQPGNGQGGEGGGMGMGLGQRTVREAAAEFGLTVPDALARLKAADLDASGDEVIRDLAKRNNRRPFEVVQVLQGQAE